MSYYNTVQSKGKTLAKAKRKASNQDAKTLRIIKHYHTAKILTPRRVWYLYKMHYGHILLTSIRRSISTLKDQNIIKDGNNVKHNCPVDNFETTEKSIHLT